MDAVAATETVSTDSSTAGEKKNRDRSARFVVGTKARSSVRIKQWGPLKGGPHKKPGSLCQHADRVASQLGVEITIIKYDPHTKIQEKYKTGTNAEDDINDDDPTEDLNTIFEEDELNLPDPPPCNNHISKGINYNNNNSHSQNNSNNNKQSKSRTPKGKRKKNNKQENEFGDKNNLETGLK